MKLFVATDIFGETPELRAWLAPIVAASGGTLELVSPYISPLVEEVMTPKNGTADELAYQQFLAQGGLSGYIAKLQQHFQFQQEPLIAIGFSAGAAALWQLAASPQPGLKQLFAFYGGQIRHCHDEQPLICTTLIWAEETHFDVVQLHTQLAKRALVCSMLTPYQHGFINPYSAGFNSKASSDYQQWLIANVNAGVRVNC